MVVTLEGVRLAQLKWPEFWDEDGGKQPEDQVQRDANLEEIAKQVPASAVHQSVCLVTDGCGKAERGTCRDTDQEGASIHLKHGGYLEDDRGHYDRDRVNTTVYR